MQNFSYISTFFVDLIKYFEIIKNLENQRYYYANATIQSKTLENALASKKAVTLECHRLIITWISPTNTKKKLGAAHIALRPLGSVVLPLD